MQNDPYIHDETGVDDFCKSYMEMKNEILVGIE